ncbi:hypothetical protein TELCIR_14993 [Teladorsagia circumcincta]|uniref:GCS light chain n=1 Tax=Teladorsagia circumcincta TaxID=45464 RepID=A0A2G9TZF6_TELCI|nr:hypothetical protein TELCIR_14993 [Teladorsagia circumcincta]
MPLRVPGSSVTIHTGNLQNYAELPKPQRKLSSSMKFSDELPAAINYLAQHGTLSTENGRVYSPHTAVFQKTSGDVKRVLKVWPTSMSPASVQDAVHIALETLHLKSLAELIVSFPLTESMNLTDSEWMQQTQPVWAAVESLVDSGAVRGVGVSDLEFKRFRLLCQEAKRHKPTAYHYSFDTMISCEVPPELFVYAETNHIHLFTHDDPKRWSFDADIFNDEFTDSTNFTASKMDLRFLFN